ncbi:MAG TPA: aminotransferase class I/II-fold pyridoxal phosphate-dependent enzyme, partial [Candidatus Krumholzibacteria bacterium]
MISLFGSNVGAEELAAVQECMDRQWLGIGNKSEEFERRIAEKCGARGFVFLNSGSNSLQMAIRLMDLPPGSQVILPSFTWIACANAIVLNGLVPVFCDVDPATCNMRPEDVEPKITPDTSAIMVVHYAGKPVDMDGMQAFGLPIIEDAAHAVDSFYKGRHCGTIGDVGILSFDAVKNLTTCEGGGVLAQDKQKIERAHRLRYCGISKSGFQASVSKTRWWEYDISEFFPKMLN